MLVIVGIGTEHFYIEVGMGSRSQIELLEEEISLAISSVVAGENSIKAGGDFIRCQIK